MEPLLALWLAEWGVTEVTGGGTEKTWAKAAKMGSGTHLWCDLWQVTGDHQPLPRWSPKKHPWPVFKYRFLASILEMGDSGL